MIQTNMNNENTNTIEISKLTGTDFIKMMTAEQKNFYEMELTVKGVNFDTIANNEYKNFKHFVMGSFHFGSSVRGFMYWNGVSNKTFDK